MFRTITAFCVPKSNPTTDIFWQSFSKFQGCAQVVCCSCRRRCEMGWWYGVVGVVVVVFVSVSGRWGGMSGRLKESLRSGVLIVEVTLRVHPALASFWACAGGERWNLKFLSGTCAKTLEITLKSTPMSASHVFWARLHNCLLVTSYIQVMRL